MDYEGALISKILLDKSMGEAIDARIPPELFVDHPKLWAWFITTYRDHGDVPPPDLVRERFPDFDIKDPGGSTSFFTEELRKRHAHTLIAECMQEQANALKDMDPFKALEAMKETVMKAELNARESRDVNITDNPTQRLVEYNELVASGGIIGIPSPWECLDEVTQGFQPEDLIMIAGRSGVGKTWAEVALAVHTWRTGLRPLLFSREMAVKQIIRRIDAIHAHLPYQRFRAGQLTREELKAWEQALKDMSGAIDFVVTGDDGGSVGVTGVAAKMRKYRPHAVYIDGAYLLEDDRGARAGWERWSNVCRDLKSLAKAEQIPITVTHQFSKEGLGDKGDGDTLKYGDVKMWFDIMIGAYQPDEMRLAKEMLFKLNKLREGPGSLEWVADWDLDKMKFDQKIAGRDDVPAVAPTETSGSRMGYGVKY